MSLCQSKSSLVTCSLSTDTYLITNILIDFNFSGTKYTVDIVTKSSFEDPSKAKVHLILHGENGDSGKRVLLKPPPPSNGKKDKKKKKEKIQQPKLFQEGTVGLSIFFLFNCKMSF